MAKRKLEIKASEEQIDTLHKKLAAGAPLQLALQSAGISIATYCYWVAIASIVITVKDQEEIDELEALAQSGVSVSGVRDMAAALVKGKRTGLGAYVEPKQESILQYKNSRRFRKFADQVYEIVQKCNQERSDYATKQIELVKVSTLKKNGINPSGAMWWLERNLPDFFAKPSDKPEEEQTADVGGVPAIEVEFINPDTPAQRDRLREIEEKILNDSKVGGKA